MQLNFLESGIDSLKKGFESLTAYERIQFNASKSPKKRQRFYHLKDAVLFIQHGIEILFKQIINKHSEYLLFTNIDDHVKKAFKEKKDRHLKSVFQSGLKHKIHTVSFLESLERLKILPGIEIGKVLETKVRELEFYRNIIMHAEPHLEEAAINSTFDGLANLLDLFFFDALGKSYKTISGYSDFVKSFGDFQKILRDNNQLLKASANELLLNSLNKAKLSMGVKEIKRFTDVNACTHFFDSLFDTELRFGTDLYNGYSSGNVKIKRSEAGRFIMNADDKMVLFEFKLKSLIIYIPNLDNKASPILFIESDHLEEDNEQLKKASGKEWDGIKMLDYYLCDDGTFITGDEEKDAYCESQAADRPDYVNVVKFYSKGIFCFMNVQGLTYNRGLKYFIQDYKFLDGKDFEVGLREQINSIDRNDPQ